jgi:hypothetical protein
MTSMLIFVSGATLLVYSAERLIVAPHQHRPLA